MLDGWTFVHPRSGSSTIYLLYISDINNTLKTISTFFLTQLYNILCYQFQWQGQDLHLIRLIIIKSVVPGIKSNWFGIMDWYEENQICKHEHLILVFFFVPYCIRIKHFIFIPGPGRITPCHIGFHMTGHQCHVSFALESSLNINKTQLFTGYK